MGVLLMKEPIEKPKVFISYAWSDEEYQELVLSFAEKLLSDGIDVVLDKWNLTEGNDTYAFMEKCVTDKTITNVLMLIDPVYAEKADNHQGGVGTETQIISAKVYKEVDQDKFIPIIMMRQEDGTVLKPTYLQSRLHFDLTDPEKYDNEYFRLVKKLYGKEVYEKPPLGKKPEWVDKPLEKSHKTLVKYEFLKNHKTDNAKSVDFKEYLDEISRKLIEFAYGKESYDDLSKYIPLYDESSEFKMDYLQLLSYSLYVTDASKKISAFFEETLDAVNKMGTTKSQITLIRIHELFIYTIAYFLKNKLYSMAGYMLSRTYFSNSTDSSSDRVDSFLVFYSSGVHDNLDKAICLRDDKNYYSGTAHYWIETIATDICSKEQFILADLVCFNYSIFGDMIKGPWHWFPITYVYDSHFTSCLSMIGKKLISREYAVDILPLWGYETLDDFVKAFKRQEEMINNGGLKDYRYGTSFNIPHLLSDFIKSENIGKYR